MKQPLNSPARVHTFKNLTCNFRQDIAQHIGFGYTLALDCFGIGSNDLSEATIEFPAQVNAF